MFLRRELKAIQIDRVIMHGEIEPAIRGDSDRPRVPFPSNQAVFLAVNEPYAPFFLKDIEVFCFALLVSRHHFGAARIHNRCLNQILLPGIVFGGNLITSASPIGAFLLVQKCV